jgi:hypothetical protein
VRPEIRDQKLEIRPSYAKASEGGDRRQDNMLEIIKKSAKSKARVGKLITAHGTIDTPAFMPVGTQGSVKAVTPQQVKEIGAQIIMSNTAGATRFSA